jgi:hypothetical protein
MTNLKIALKYFSIFQKKNLYALEKMFAKDIELRDWNVSAKGIKKVLKINQKIFSSCETLKVKPVKTYTSDNYVIAELKIKMDDKYYLVLDILKFNKNKTN